MLGNKVTYAIGVMDTMIPDEAVALPLSRRAMYSVIRVIWTGYEGIIRVACRLRCDDGDDVPEALRKREVREQNERLISSKACSV